MYRPQFSFSEAQQGTYDEDFVYSFDPYNTPALDIRFGPAEQLLRLPLQMQSDAAFIHRGLRMNPALTSFLGAQLFFPDDTPLSDDLLPISAFSANTGNPAPIIEAEMLSPAGASYQVNIVNRSATQSAMPLVLDPGLVLVDPVNFGHGPVTSVVVPSANGFGPIAFNGALYMALQTNSSAPFQIEIMQSLDGGDTWQQVGAVGDPNGNASPVFDGDHTIIVAFSTSAVQVDGDLNLINFDLSTLTWGPVYGDTSPPTTQVVYQTFIRPDGTIVVLNNPHPSGAGSGGSGLVFSVWDGTSWTNIDAGAGILGLPGYDATQDFVDWTAAVVDATGNTHIFFLTTGQAGPPNWSGRVFYQQVHADNTLGTFFDFPGNAGAPPFTIQSVLNSNPIIVGDNILLGVTLNNPAGSGLFAFYASLIVGVGLAAPVFSYMPTPGIDPTVFGSIFPGTEGQTAPYLLFDGRTIFAIYPAGFGDLQLRVCYTNTPLSPLSGWTSVQVFDANDIGLPFNIPFFQQLLRPSLNLAGNQIFITTDAQAPTSSFGTNARYFLGSMIVEPVRIQLRGVKRYVRTKRSSGCK